MMVCFCFVRFSIMLISFPWGEKSARSLRPVPADFPVLLLFFAKEAFTLAALIMVFLGWIALKFILIVYLPLVL